MTDKEDGVFGIRIDVDITTSELFVFCLDLNTNELFEALTDRPVSFLSSLEQHGNDSGSFAINEYKISTTTNDWICDIFKNARRQAHAVCGR